MLEDTPRPRRVASSSVTAAEAHSLKIELWMGLIMPMASCCLDMLFWCEGKNLHNYIRVAYFLCSKPLGFFFVWIYSSFVLARFLLVVELSLNFLLRIVHGMMAGKVIVTNKTPAWCFKQLL